MIPKGWETNENWLYCMRKVPSLQCREGELRQNRGLLELRKQNSRARLLEFTGQSTGEERAGYRENFGGL